MPARKAVRDPHSRKSGRPFFPPPQQESPLATCGAQHDGTSDAVDDGGGVIFNRERLNAWRPGSFSGGGLEQQSDIFVAETSVRGGGCRTGCLLQSCCSLVAAANGSLDKIRFDAQQRA
jgi:hypothetical protein